MPYIAFELDAMERAPEVARALGLSVGDTAWGMLQMWRWCWREKTDLVSAIHLQGFFGAPAGTALEAFGFVAPAGPHFRVRGAARYLKIAEAKSKGGKAAAAAGNLKRGKTRSAGPSAGKSLQHPPSTLPADSQQPPSSTASSDERLTTSESKDIAPAAPPPPVSRTRRVSDALVAEYLKRRGEAYSFRSEIDGPALARILKRCPDDVLIVARWSKALSLAAFPGCSTVAQFDTRWNDLTAPTAAPKGSVIHGQTAWGPNDDFATALAGGTP